MISPIINVSGSYNACSYIMNNICFTFSKNNILSVHIKDVHNIIIIEHITLLDIMTLLLLLQLTSSFHKCMHVTFHFILFLPRNINKMQCFWNNNPSVTAIQTSDG